MKYSILSGTAILFLSACGVSEKQVNPSISSENSIHLSYMDLSVSPKDDFFKFANGNWIKNNPVPGTESQWGSFNELDKSNKEKLTIILKDAQAANAPSGSDKQLIGDFYSSFLNQEIRNEKGLKPIEGILNQIKEVSTLSQITQIVSNLHMRGVSVFFSIGVGQDLANPDKTSIYLGQSGIGLPSKEYYFDSKKKDILVEYEKHIAKTAKLAGASDSDASKFSTNVINFETKLAENMMTPVEQRDIEKMFNLKSFKETSSNFDQINFNLYLKLMQFPAFDTAIITQVDYMKKLDKIIAQSSLDEVKAYLAWSVLDGYSSLLSDEFVQQDFYFNKTILSGKKEMKPASDRAIEDITNLPISEVLGKLFVQKHFSEKANKQVNTMVDNLLVVFKQRIDKLSWMSDETKKQALIKLTSIGRKLGYPEKWEDFSKIKITKDDYTGNMDQLTKYSILKNYEEYKKPVDKSKWGMPAHMVNAYYNPLNNEIAFPAGIMQPPFFDENAEDAVNYATIGMVIGHEFTHGFDDFGSKFDATGSFRNWWSEDDRKQFDARTKTLGETFSNFCPIEGHCVNPELTMGENIADLGGITLSFYAYQLTEEYRANKKINGYTPAQRFFISFAQLWKINYTEAELKNRLANDSHSPGMYRVNGPLRNCPEFFEAFNIKEGDAMRNREGRLAKIW